MKAKNLKELSPSSSTKFFLDTNVWLYLYFPQYSNVAKHIIEKYSSAFDEILEKNCLIVTDVIQMSELINLVLHIEFKEFQKTNPTITFKQFRNSVSSIDAFENAKLLAKNILKSATLRGGIFTEAEIITIVHSCDKADFNDIYFARFCDKESATLITHDFDFNALDIEIKVYSGNSKYYA